MDRTATGASTGPGSGGAAKAAVERLRRFRLSPGEPWFASEDPDEGIWALYDEALAALQAEQEEVALFRKQAGGARTEIDKLRAERDLAQARSKGLEEALEYLTRADCAGPSTRDIARAALSSSGDGQAT